MLDVYFATNDWRLLTNPRRASKLYLLQNESIFPSVSITCSTAIKEKYHNFQLLLEKIRFSKHEIFFIFK